MHGRAESQVTLASRSSAVEKAMQMEIQKVRAPANVLLGGEIVGKDDGFSCNQFHKRLINSSHARCLRRRLHQKTGSSLNLMFYMFDSFSKDFILTKTTTACLKYWTKQVSIPAVFMENELGDLEMPCNVPFSKSDIQRFPFRFSSSKKYLELRNFTYSHGVNLTNQTLLNEKSINHQNHMVAAMWSGTRQWHVWFSPPRSMSHHSSCGWTSFPVDWD